VTTANVIRSRGQIKYSERQAFFPLDYNFLYKRQERYFQCSYCGIFVYQKRLSRDHVYPKSKGGPATTPSCYPCNETKKDMLPIEWAVFAYNEGLDIAKTQYEEVVTNNPQVVITTDEQDWTKVTGATITKEASVAAYPT
jgi:hypothetical protein